MDQPELPLLFDRQSSNATPDLTSIRTWGARQSVFVSSLISSMGPERDAVRTAIEGVGARPVMFEHDLGGQDVPAERAYLDGVRQSSIYVGLFGPRYGVRLASGRSATHDELAEAERLGLRLAVYTTGYGTPEMDGDQRDLVDGLRNLYTTAGYASPEDLGQKVHRRLTDLAAEELLPWVKIGRLLVRAERVDSGGGSVSVTAGIADRAIIAELKRLEEQRASIPATTHLDAFHAQVERVSTTVVNAAVTDVTVTLRQVDDRSRQAHRMQINSLSADEVTRASLSDGLFGTTELPQDNWGTFRPVDPLAPLRGLGIPEGSLRPIAQLLLTDHLLRGAHASSVEPVALGPNHQGRRRLRLTWRPPRQYVNTPDPEPIRIEGDVTGF